MRSFFKSQIKPGPTAEELVMTRASVYGEVVDDQQRKVSSRLQGPEAGVNWTSLTALAAVEKVLAGEVQPGFQTPSRAFGADFVLECEGVTRQDVI